MKKQSEIVVELLSDAVNRVVLKTPGRSFPGIVIQGDSLARLYRSAAEVCQRAKSCGDEELIGEAALLCHELADRLACYENALISHGIALPYANPISSEVTD